MSITWSYMSGHGWPLVTTSLINQYEKKITLTHTCFWCNLQYNTNQSSWTDVPWVGVATPLSPMTSRICTIIYTYSREIGLLPCLWYKHHACGDLSWVDCLRCHESGKHYNMGVATPLPSCISISYHLHLCSTPYSINMARKGWIGCGNATSPIYPEKQ